MSMLYLLFLLLWIALPARAQPVKPFDVEAHQGGIGLYPSNSIQAFLNAVRMGVTTLDTRFPQVKSP